MHLAILDTWHIYNAFYISLLCLFRGTFPNMPIIDDPRLLTKDSEILILEAIIDHRDTMTHCGIFHHKYLLKYRNHGLESAKWMVERFFRSHPNLLEAYHNT